MLRACLQLRVMKDGQEWTGTDYVKEKLGNSTVRRHTSLFSAIAAAAAVLVIVLMVPHLHHAKTANSGLAEERAAAAKVSKHYLLPTNETPALATVTDTKKLTTPFLKNAKDGDEILIYQKNQIAIIYRPSIDRIIAVGPVTIDTPPTPNSNGGQGQTFTQ